MSSQNCTGPVQLFGEDEAGEGVRHGQGPEGEEELSAAAGLFAPSVCGTDREDNLARSLVPPLPNPRREALRRHLPAPAVEQNSHRRSPALLAIEPLKEGVLGPERHGLCGHKRRCTFEIKLTQSVEPIPAVASGTDVGQDELHTKQDTAARAFTTFLDFGPLFSNFS